MSKKWVSIYCFIFMMVTTVVWAKPDSVYIDNGNGTVTDIETKLMWQQGSAAPSLVFAIELSTIQNAIKQSGARWEAVVFTVMFLAESRKVMRYLIWFDKTYRPMRY
jgi:hypothetical protein